MRIDTFLPYRLAVVAKDVTRLLHEVYGQRFGFSREEWRLLFLLEEADTLDSVQIAQRTSLDKVQVSRAAARLRARELITSETHPTDRRLRSYSITRYGRDRFSEAFIFVEKKANDILKEMDEDDRHALERGLGALHQALASVNQKQE
ncbi:MarR family transcriptional regulator [Enterobacteriaceae bacterium 4M9]|nr:MarR family transcriptional regulator [Enterobacteriaceae bacterium 4M9]